MSSNGEVGVIYETPGEMSIEWEIPNYFCLEKDGYYESPLFAFAQHCWCLLLYPRDADADACTSISLVRKCSSVPVTVDFTGSIGCKDLKMKLNEFKGQNFFLRTELHKIKLQLVPLGTLTIYCNLKSDIKSSTKASQITRLWNCCHDLKQTLDVEDKKDFTFLLRNGRKQSAHKLILESRCEYFKKMFGNEWLENKTGESNLSHIEEKTFKNVLSYLYSGDVNELDEKNAYAIYAIAHELQLEDLKLLCTGYMKRSMSMDTFYDILLIAETYNEKELKKYSLKFLDENTSAIFESDKWEEFREQNSVIASRFLQRALMKNKKLC